MTSSPSASSALSAVNSSAPFPATAIQTRRGRIFDLANPSPGAIDPYDIASSLSKLCRFNGHTREFYSVAQHSVLVALRAGELAEGIEEHETMRWGLLHDAHEAYTGDFTRPLKKLLETGPVALAKGDRNVFPLRPVQGRIDAAILARFGVQVNAAAESLINRADIHVLAAERRDVMEPGLEWGELAGIAPAFGAARIQPLDPARAFMLFEQVFDNLFAVQPWGVAEVRNLVTGSYSALEPEPAPTPASTSPLVAPH